MANRNVTDTEGRVWRRCAIPDGVTLANGESKERIEEELRKKKQRAKEQERKAKDKARRKAQIKREKLAKNGKNVLEYYTPLWGINDKK